MPDESNLERERGKGSLSSSLKGLRSGRATCVSHSPTVQHHYGSVQHSYTLKQQDSEELGLASQLLFSWSGPVGPFFKNIYPASFTRHHTAAPTGMATPSIIQQASQQTQHTEVDMYYFLSA